MKKTLCIAGFVLWMLCWQLYAETSPEEMSRLFQRGVERLQTEQVKIFGKRVEIIYDVKKTNSLVQPVIGILKIEEPYGNGGDKVYKATFAFQNGTWKINSFSGIIAYGVDESEDNVHNDPIPSTEATARRIAIEKCFSTEQ